MIFLHKCLFELKTLLVVAIFALLGACGDDPPLEVSLETEQEPSDCIDGGRLAVEAFGALNSDIDWRDASIRCEGMQRPQGKGARLRFSGEIEFAGNAWPLAFILSIPDLERGATADELATRVTLIEEENSRFFSTRETDICWSNVTEQTPLKDSAGTVIEHYYRISGLTYCVAPIAELNGAASITLSDLKFTGQLHWPKKEQ